ncbi:MAG: PAS domain S-box protein, partial [Gemmatimonadaceae bacterium]|nr:PAS domain S-box protein [Gemmatimonadaceae bacterium]
GLQVPGTDWLLIAKIDRDEFYAPAVEVGAWIGLAGLLGLLVVSVALVLVHQRRSLQFSAMLQEKQAERLRALQLLDSIAASSTDVIYAKDVDGRYLLHNPAADRLTGREPGTAIGQDDRALYPPEEAAALMANDRRVMTSGAVETFEETLPLPDGPRTMLSTKGPLRDAEGRVIGLFGISHDVTEMRRVQEALAEDAVRRRILIEQSRDAIVVLDQDGGIHESNPRFAEMLGRTTQEVADLHVWDWDPDWTRERVLSKLRDFDRASLLHETRWRRADGRLFPVEVASTQVEWGGRRLVYCVCRDITERKRAEQALIESERRWIMALDSAGHGVWDCNLSTGRVFYSDRWKEILGYGADEIGATLDEWKSRVHPDDLHACLRELDRHLAGETSAYRSEHRMRCKDGAYKWILGQGMVVERDAPGRPRRMVGTHTDLSWRIAAEAQLRASEERYRSMVSVLNEGILLFDREGRIRATNPAAARILGVPEERLLGMSALDPSLLALREDGSPIEPDDLPVVQCLTDGRPRRESVLGWRHASGALRWLEINAEPIVGEPGAAPAAVAVSFTDITERREAEAQLRKLSLAVTQSPNGVQITDVDAKLEYVNAAFERMSGYTAAELLGRNPNVMASGRTPRATYDEMWAALERGEVWSGELINRRKNGEIYVEHARIAPVRNVDGRVTHYLAIKEDVTEHRRVAAELDRHRHHLQELVTERTRQLELVNRTLSDRSAEIADLYNNAPCGYHSLDADGVFLSVNDTELAMLGYTREELVGRMSFRDLLVPATRERFAHTFAKFRREGHVRDLEFEVIRKDGSLLPVTVHATVVRDASGAMLRTRSTMIDDTERRARDREISTLNAELTRRAGEAEAANRAKSAFLANMSHEIRTPLNAILGLSHLLLRKVATPADRDKLERITQAGRHLLAIINDVLDLSKIEAGKLSLELLDFDLTPLLQEVCDLVAERARAKGLDVVVDVDPALPSRLRGDRTRLLQALLNYASNAVKFTERGSVHISARVQAREGGDLVARFEVVDTGIGIDPQYHDRLFGAFEQADSSTTRRYG